MSSDVQSALTSLQQNNYVSLAILTAIGYDYVLTFSKEIEYIWGKPWTSVSTLFVIVRFCGLYSVAIPMLSKINDIASLWTFVLFLAAADFVMMLRIWAMYNRSRLVLGALLALFCVEIIFTIVNTAIDDSPNNLLAITVQMQNFSFCVVEAISFTWTKVATILQITHGATMCTLAIVQFLRESLRMYRVTKQWQPSRYMKFFVKEGVLYFFAIVLFSLLSLLGSLGKLPSGGWQGSLLIIVAEVPVYTLTPRFIINMRELYARTVQVGRGGGIDTAFGLSSFGRGIGGTGIVFAEAGQSDSEGLETGASIPMEAVEVVAP